MGKRALEFTDRWMFNRVLCVEDVCRGVLRASLGIEVGEISYLNAEQCYEPGAGDRGVRMDVVAKEEGRVYDIEIQVSREPRIGRRMRYYQSAMDVSELGRGDDVADLPESYIVFFCQRDPFGLALPSYTVERVCAEAPALDVGSGSHWLALNAQAWEAAAGDPLGEVLEYVGTGRATGPLTARIDGLVEEFNDDEGWVRRVITLEQDTAMRCRRAKEQGASEVAALMAALLDAGRIDDARRAAEDAAARDELARELGLAGGDGR